MNIDMIKLLNLRSGVGDVMVSGTRLIILIAALAFFVLSTLVLLYFLQIHKNDIDELKKLKKKFAALDENTRELMKAYQNMVAEKDKFEALVIDEDRAKQRLSGLEKEIENKTKEKERLDGLIGNTDQLGEMRDQYEKLRDELKLMDDQLESKKNRFHQVKGWDGGGDGEVMTWTLDPLSDDEKRLIGLIGEFSKLPAAIEFKKELAELEWKKIWLGPRLQEWSGIPQRGIYMLVADDGRVYVGQAVDIKKRWYEHAKKIIGVVDCGNERLYRELSGRLDRVVKWRVLEEVVNGDLDEAEHYWIDFFKATDPKHGFNKMK